MKGKMFNRIYAYKEFKQYVKKELGINPIGTKYEVLYEAYYSHVGEAKPKNKKLITKDIVNRFGRQSLSSIKSKTKPEKKTKREAFLEKVREKKSVSELNNSDFYTSIEWIWLRQIPLKLFGKKCMKCGGENEIHVDHIKPRSKYIELQLSPMNLQILCKVCNTEKTNSNETDYRTTEQVERLIRFLSVGNFKKR